MRNNRVSSKPASPLVRLFVERSKVCSAGTPPEQVIYELVERNRRTRSRTKEREIQHYLRDRNIMSVELSSNLNCDGMLEPIGSGYTDGFRMYLNKNAPQVRVRFTMAHEMCHTFFYELVPELKFQLHSTDAEEERLCNVGAAALLIPDKPLRRRVKDLPISLDSLEALAAEHTVSLPTMLLRLRALGIWKCQLSHWHRTVGGTFVLDRLHGGKRVDWTWEDTSTLERAWISKKSEFGRSFVSYVDVDGVRQSKPISYNLRPLLDGVTVLWGVGVRTAARSFPLFQVSK